MADSGDFMHFDRKQFDRISGSSKSARVGFADEISTNYYFKFKVSVEFLRDK